MTANGATVSGNRRRNRAAGERLVSEFQQSGLSRKAFCAAHGLNVHTLDAWRKRVASKGPNAKIVPVEIVEDRTTSFGAPQEASMQRSGQFRVVLADGLRVEIEPGFDAVELRRLIAALDSAEWRGNLSQRV